MAKKFKRTAEVFPDHVYKDREPDTLKVIKSRTRTEYLVEITKDGSGGDDDVGRRYWRDEDQLVGSLEEVKKLD